MPSLPMLSGFPGLGVPTDALTDARLRATSLARKFAHYDGAAPDPLAANGDGYFRDIVKPNLGRYTVDGFTAVCGITKVKITTDETAAITDAEAFVEAAWPEARRAAVLAKLRTYGGVSGHSFARVVPTGDGLRVIALDPAAVTVRTDPMDAERALAYEHTVALTENGRTSYRRQTHTRVADAAGRTTGWEITEATSRDGAKWVTVGEPVAWNSPLCQIVDAPNLLSAMGYYGTADLEDDVLDLIEAGAYALSNAARVARYLPPIEKTQGLISGDDKRAYERRGPGSVVHFSDESQDASIVEPSGVAITKLIELYREISGELARVTAYPDLTATDVALFGGSSGRALEVRLAPMIARVEALRANYGALVVGIVERLFAFSGIEPPTVRVSWPSILPADPVADADLAAKRQSLGASAETVLETAGLDPATEAARSQAAAAATPAPAGTVDLGTLLDRLGAPAA